jgi:hypothetical protein
MSSFDGPMSSGYGLGGYNGGGDDNDHGHSHSGGGGHGHAPPPEDSPSPPSGASRGAAAAGPPDDSPPPPRGASRGAAAAAPPTAASLAAAAGRNRKNASSSSSKWTGGQVLATVTLSFMVLSGALTLYDALFPDLPTRLNVSDRDSYARIFASGKPAFVLCENTTVVVEKVGTAMMAAARAASAPVSAYRIDCAAPLPTAAGGAGEATDNVYKRYNIHRHWTPAFFVVGNGLRPHQLPPGISYNATEMGTALAAAGVLKTRHTRIDHDRDLDACIRGRSGGCLIAYTAKDAKVLGEELMPVAEEHRAVQVAVLRASTVLFRSTSDALTTLVKANVAKARELSAEDASARGVVLIFIKKLSPALNGGVTGGLLVTVRACDGTVVRESDAAAVMQLAKDAAGRLKELSGGGGGGGGGGVADAIDALLERDEKLAEMGAAVVTRGEMSIARPPPKPTATPRPASEETGSGSGSGGGARRVDTGNAKVDAALRKSEERRAARERRAAAGEAAGAASDGSEEDGEGEEGEEGGFGFGGEGEGEGEGEVMDEEEERLARERRRRQQMEEEAAKSAHVAHAAEEGEDRSDESAGRGEEEVVGLEDDEEEL